MLKRLTLVAIFLSFIICSILGGCSSNPPTEGVPNTEGYYSTNSTESSLSFTPTEQESTSELFGVWKMDKNNPANQADLLILNSNHTFYAIILGSIIPFYDVHIISSGTFLVDTNSITLNSHNGSHDTVSYAIEDDVLTLRTGEETDSFYRQHINSTANQSVVGEWLAYGTDDAVFNLTQDGTFKMNNGTIANNISSGTYTYDENNPSQINLYTSDGTYIKSLTLLGYGLMIDAINTSFLYQINVN